MVGCRAESGYNNGRPVNGVSRDSNIPEKSVTMHNFLQSSLFPNCYFPWRGAGKWSPDVKSADFFPSVERGVDNGLLKLF